MALEKVTLDSGLTVYNDRIAGAKTNNVSVFVPYGSVNEQIGHEGVAHVFEHCVHLETDLFASKTALTNYATHAGMVRNANTFYTRTLYYANGLEVTPNLNFLSQILQHTHFPEDMVEHELKAVRRETTTNLDDIPRLHTVASSNAMFGYPYGRAVAGYHDKIDFSSETLKELYKRYYKLGNMSLITTGNMRTQDITALAEQYFHDDDNEVPESIAEPAEQSYGQHHRTGLVREDAHSLSLSVTYPITPEFREQFNKNRLVYCMALIAMSHDCFERLRYDAGISYNGSISPALYNHPNAWSIDGDVTIDAENTGQAEAIFAKVFSKDGRSYPDEKLEGTIAVQKYMMAQTINTVEGHSGRIISQLASYAEPTDIRSLIPKLKKITVKDVRDGIDAITSYVAETPKYTHLTGTRADIGEVERIIDQSEIA